MTADYTQDIADAVEMIEDFGGPATFSRLSPTVDTAQPWRNVDAAAETFSATCVMVEYKVTQQSQGFTAGSEDVQGVLPGDMLVYLAAGNDAITFIPAPRDIVETASGLRFGVVDRITVSPNGQDILYKLWVRK